MVYIELVLLVNLLIHFLIVKNSCLLLGKKINYKLLLISLSLDSIYMAVYCYYPSYIENVSYLIILLISIVNFIGTKKQMFMGTILYVSQNFLLGGVSEILYISTKFNIYYIFIIIIIIILISIIYKELNKYTFNLKKLMYKVKIVDNNQTIYLEGFCDTGNFLTDEHFIPVIFINTKYKIGKKVKSINSQSINVKNNLQLYKVDEFYILINDKYIKKDIYIAYSNLNFEVMFGLNLLGG